VNGHQRDSLSAKANAVPTAGYRQREQRGYANEEKTDDGTTYPVS
jgi:hypothetical protein